MDAKEKCLHDILCKTKTIPLFVFLIYIYIYIKLRNATKLPCEDMIFMLSLQTLDNMYVRFGDKVFREILGTPIQTNFTLFIADLYL